MMFFLNQTPANPDTVDKVLAALKQAGGYIANMGEFAFKEYARLVYADGVSTLAVMAFFALLSVILVTIAARMYNAQRGFVETSYEFERKTCKFGELSKQEQREYYNQPGVYVLPNDGAVVTLSRRNVQVMSDDARWAPCVVTAVIAGAMSIITLISFAAEGPNAITKIIAPSGWAIRSIIQDVSKVK